MISDNFKEVAYSQETDVAYIVLLKLSTSELSDDLYLCNIPVEKFTDLGENIYGCTSNSQRYIFLPFQVVLPHDDKTGVITAKLTIDNINRQIVQYARQTKKAIDVDVSVVLSNNLDNIEIEYKGFKLTNVTYDGFTVSGNLSIEYLGSEPFPAGRFTPSGFTGLF